LGDENNGSAFPAVDLKVGEGSSFMVVFPIAEVT
jgi:hypothetical protein